MPLRACLYRPSAPEREPRESTVLHAIADAFSPRSECVDADCALVDLDGLQRLFGSPRHIGEALHQHAQTQQPSINVAIAGTYTAARLLAMTRDGLSVTAAGRERHAVAPLPITALETLFGERDTLTPIVRRWGIHTLGELAALPTADLRARLGARAIAWQQAARGEDTRPLRPTRAEERFENEIALEWPVETIEPLSFILTRLLEPLCVQLEHRDRGVAAMHVMLRLTTRDTVSRHLDLPAPMRDVRTLRTLLLLHMEAHPPEAAIDHVALVLDPTPARIVQHTLFAAAQPAPEQVSTLLARLTAIMGTDRVGTPVAMDTDRPGAFEIRAFRTTWDADRAPAGEPNTSSVASSLVSAFRAYRPPVPVRVTVDASGIPTYVTVDRTGLEGGAVRACAGPWITSGAWWMADRWDQEEWDVHLTRGIVYRLAYYRVTRRWFIQAVAD